jgi:hypothetical protein
MELKNVLNPARANLQATAPQINPNENGAPLKPDV